MPSALSTIELFLVAMAIIFTVPYLIWRLGRTDYWARRMREVVFQAA